MSEWQQFRARAEQARADAESSDLQNVKDRCLRAEAAWMAMAERGERAEAMRHEREAGKSGP